jgi:hypothetical protein
LTYRSTHQQLVDIFVYEMGLQEPNLSKRAKIDYLRLTADEWIRVGKFADLLSVRGFSVVFCYYFAYEEFL